jgi:hypothetical protein
MMAALLDYLNQCQTESEVCEVLTVIFLTPPVGRPMRTALPSRIHCPSILADLILEKTYGSVGRVGRWEQSHSGTAPVDFQSTSYFEEHKTAHAPPVLLHNLETLGKISGQPFLRQWAFEWSNLRKKLDTRCTGYPYYFDNPSDVRAGINGQYWQRMRDVYISAYLKTLAYAVSNWDMPLRIAHDYCVNLIPGISDFFDVEPIVRPTWLLDIPERICSLDNNFISLMRELIQVAQFDGRSLFSLDTPVALSVQKFARLRLSSHLVTRDYEIPDSRGLSEEALFLSIKDTFMLKGLLPKKTIDEAYTVGKVGNEITICNRLFPIPFGTWQSDYLQLGLRIPAPYMIPDAEVRCSSNSIDCVLPEGKVVSETSLWNDDWIPTHPKESPTRCGTATMINREIVEDGSKLLGRELAFFARLQIWDRDGDYGTYEQSERTLFFRY